jgi:hypothetical protein
MEEEGIYYLFKHAADGHKMVIANTPHSHSPLPVQDRLIYEDVEGAPATRDASSTGRRSVDAVMGAAIGPYRKSRLKDVRPGGPPPGVGTNGRGLHEKWLCFFYTLNSTLNG